MLLMIRYVPLIVILICTIIKFYKQHRTAGMKDYRNLLVSLVSMGGYLLVESTPTLSFLGFRINELSVGFFLVAIGAVSGKRLWSLIGALWFSLHSVVVFVTGQGDSLIMAVNATACLFLTVVAFYQNKAHKELPLVLWIALLAVCLLSRNWGINITLLAMIVWFSPKLEKKVKTSQFATEPERTTENTTDLEEKLATLENLQALLVSGAISKEEFEAKKKQLLGLSNTYSAPTMVQSIGKCNICGRENVPIESTEVIVAGMSRKRTMCAECAAKYK
ncbi:MAG: SHOCT domain-containing protein [Clostridia bacterium]|nr:SHOCT domain-containing protein [Clostridia bacterium]